MGWVGLWGEPWMDGWMDESMNDGRAGKTRKEIRVVFLWGCVS